MKYESGYDAVIQRIPPEPSLGRVDLNRPSSYWLRQKRYSAHLLLVLGLFAQTSCNSVARNNDSSSVQADSTVAISTMRPLPSLEPTATQPILAPTATEIPSPTPIKLPTFSPSPTPDPRPRGVFTVDGNDIVWTNESKLKFNEEAGIEVFRQLSQLPGRIPSFELQLTGDRKERIKGSIKGRERFSSITLFQHDPNKDEKYNQTMTQVVQFPDFVFTISRIAVYDLKPNEEFIKQPDLIYSDGTRTFAVEACQASIKVEPEAGSAEDELLLQEGWCNSWGHAVAMRKKGFGYQEYVQFASKVVLALSESGPSFEVLTIPESEYLNISTDPVFVPER